MKNRKRIIAALLMLSAGPLAIAGTSTNTLGEKIARKGAGDVPACAICHGDHGEGNLKAGYPRLAGMNAEYLDQQMTLYAQDERKNRIMQEYAQKLSIAERRAVSDYYANQTADSPHIDIQTIPPQAAKLLQVGAPNRGIPSCFSCHGDNGQGNKDGIAPIAGQPAIYFIHQMNAWRFDERPVTEGNPMAVIAKTLTLKEIALLAHALQ
ncbi:MAG: c-type cytochrome [Halothiobacillus sp.]|nr:c-type cytochrome [Halothiobacillus sp.]